MKRRYLTYLILLLILSTGLTSCVDTLPEARPALMGEVPIEGEVDSGTDGGDGNTTNEITRPDGLIKMKADHCSCKDSKPTMLGICDSFCASKPAEAEYLYINFEMGVLELDENFSTLEKWCKTPITKADETIETPNCNLQIQSEGSPATLIKVQEASDFFDGNSIRVSVGGQFQDGVTYILTLTDTTSGAKTTSVNYTRKQDPPDVNNLGPLQILPVNQYTCMTRGFATNEIGEYFYETAYRLHFYYTAAEEPPAIPPGVRTVFCHDIYDQTQTLDDKQRYPRLELAPGHFNTWNYNDTRFALDDTTGNMKIHDSINKLVEAAGGTYNPSQTIFFPFSWPSYPKQALPSELQSDTMPDNSKLGFVMTPWVDNTTFKVYCPNQTHYYSNNQLFNSLRELVGVDTEGLYLSVREILTTTDGNGKTVLATDDYLLIREGLLKKIWFYYQNGQHIRADENTASTKTVHFYWPPDPENPFMKKSNQLLYTVRHPSDFQNPASSNQDATSGNGQIKGDKKFACVPAILDDKFGSNYVTSIPDDEGGGEYGDDDDEE